MSEVHLNEFRHYLEQTWWTFAPKRIVKAYAEEKASNSERGVSEA
jgi:hypothetical protein